RARPTQGRGGPDDSPRVLLQGSTGRPRAFLLGAVPDADRLRGATHEEREEVATGAVTLGAGRCLGAEDWATPTRGGQQVAPPLLVYAELLHSGRERETARIIYERYLERLPADDAVVEAEPARRARRPRDVTKTSDVRRGPPCNSERSCCRAAGALGAGGPAR